MGTGTDEPRGEPRAHHDLGIYDTDEFLIAAVVETIAQAIADGATGVAILPARHHDAVRRGLIDRDLDVSAALETGDYIEADSDEFVAALMQDGEFTTERVRRSLDRLLAGAIGEGRESRVCADLFSRPWRRGRHRPVLDVERWWNARSSERTVSLLCLYDSEIFRNSDGDDPFISLCEEHVLVAPWRITPRSSSPPTNAPWRCWSNSIVRTASTNAASTSVVRTSPPRSNAASPRLPSGANSSRAHS